MAEPDDKKGSRWLSLMIKRGQKGKRHSMVEPDDKKRGTKDEL